MLLVQWLACDEPTSSTGSQDPGPDTGVPAPTEPIVTAPTGFLASYIGNEYDFQAGMILAHGASGGEQRIAVSSAGGPVAFLTPTLAPVGRLSNGDHPGVVAFGDDIAVGYPDHEILGAGGGVYILREPVVGDIDVSTVSDVVRGSSRSYFGVAVAWSDVTGDGVELIVGAPRYKPGGSSIYKFSPDISGTNGLEAATGITEGFELGWAIAPWEATGDGIADLVVEQYFLEVLLYLGPWDTDRGYGTWDARWVSDIDQAGMPGSYGDGLSAIGDLDNDGLDELFIGAHTYTLSVAREGRAHVVAGGTTTSSDASDLPWQFVGMEEDEKLGNSACGGDYDGDGTADLVIGAEGADRVYGYLGPVERGEHSMLDADFVIAAPPTPFAKPGFGWACASYDATGDGRTDLLVSDPTAVEYRGAVYLFSGDDIAP